MLDLRRRQFITLLGGAAAAWPVATRAQQNVAIEFRWADGQYDRLPELAGDLVRRQVSVIATPGTGAAGLAAKTATATIPIVFGVAADPVKLGLVASINRPGGNATGINFFSTELVAKRMQLLRELLPTARRIGLLVNPTDAANESIGQDVEASAGGLQVIVLEAGSIGEIDAAFASLVREKIDALFIAPGAFFSARRVQLAVLGARHNLPTIQSTRHGLMSYGTDNIDAFRQVGLYTGRILNGAKPADLPVLQSSKFELVFNVSTARALGITIPPSLLAVADEVID
jgi:putative tryptophan/tyrosine transport system substrate-binding protein